MKNLTKAIAIAVACALVGGLLVGDALGGWFQEIEQPWYALPLWGWGIVGGLYYVMAIAILTRLLGRPADRTSHRLVFLTIGMMVFNELWNFLLFGLESPLAGLLGLIPFVVYVAFLQMALWKHDRVSAWMLLPYVVWLVYDLFWISGLWILNS